MSAVNYSTCVLSRCSAWSQKLAPQPLMPPLLPNTHTHMHPHLCPTRHKLHNQLMELQNPAWRGLTNSSRLQAPAILTSVPPDCGEAGRTRGACLLASAGRKASRLRHNSHMQTHTLHPAVGVVAGLAHTLTGLERGASNWWPCLCLGSDCYQEREAGCW